MATRDEACVEWQGCRHSSGYGLRHYNGGTRRAHRVAYCEAHGLALVAIDGLLVRHKCDNRACVNPAHLELGTHADNHRDMRERGRARGNTACRGAPRSKLSDADVAAIRAEYRPQESGRGCAALAKKYGVSFQHVHRIVNNRSRVCRS